MLSFEIIGLEVIQSRVTLVRVVPTFDPGKHSIRASAVVFQLRQAMSSNSRVAKNSRLCVVIGIAYRAHGGAYPISRHRVAKGPTHHLATKHVSDHG